MHISVAVMHTERDIITCSADLNGFMKKTKKNTVMTVFFSLLPNTFP